MMQESPQPGYSGTRQSLRRFGVVIGILAAIIVIVLGIVWLIQRSMIYYPDTSEVPAAAEVLEGGEDLTLKTSDGLELGAWFAPAAAASDDRDMAVLMAPGNAGNRENRVGLAQHLQDQGFAVLLMDYRGYSTNPGSPSEDGLLRDGRAALDALAAQEYSPDQLIYFAESLGGGVIAALLSEGEPPAAAIFRSPFSELADVASYHYPFLPVRVVLRDRFPVTDHVRDTEVPVTVIRAENDTVIPTHLSTQVAMAASNLLEEQVIEAADHNDPVMFGPEIAEAVARASDAIEQ